MDCTELNAIDVGSSYSTDPGYLKNVVVLRLVLKRRVVVSNKAISAIRGWKLV